MRLYNIFFASFIGIILLLGCQRSWAQDTIVVRKEKKKHADKRLTRTTEKTLALVKKEANRSIQLRFGTDGLDHRPDTTDYQRYNEYKNLISDQPTKSNHDLYFLLCQNHWPLI